MKKTFLIVLTMIMVFALQAQTNWAQMMPPTTSNLNTFEYVNSEVITFGNDFGYHWLNSNSSWELMDVYGQIDQSCYNAGYLMIAGQDFVPAISSEEYDFEFWASVPGVSWDSPVTDLFSYLDGIVILPAEYPLAGIFTSEGIDTLQMLNYPAQQGFSIAGNLFVVYADNNDLMLYNTNDYGQNWNNITFDFEGVAVSSSVSAYGKIAIAINNGDDSYVVTSDDAGYTWAISDEFQDKHLVSVSFLYNEAVVAGNDMNTGFFYDGNYEWFNEHVTKVIATDNTLFEVIVSGDSGSVFMRANNLLGLNDLKDQEIMSTVSVYPNPFQNNVTINNLPQNSQIKIYDIAGREIMTGTYSDKVVLEINQPSGMYFIKIMKNDQCRNIKVLKN